MAPSKNFPNWLRSHDPQAKIAARKPETKLDFATIGPFSTTAIVCSGAMGNILKLMNIVVK